MAGVNGLRPVCREKFRNIEADVIDGKTEVKEQGKKIDRITWLLVTTLVAVCLNFAYMVVGK